MKILKALRDILTILFFPSFLAKLFYKPYSFAWVVHSRDMQDLHNRFPITKVLPKRAVLSICKMLWPIIVSDIVGVKDKNGEKRTGCIIGIPLLPDQILGDKVLAEKKIIQVLKLAEKIGIKNVVLAGYNSVITNGGETIFKKTSLFLTNSYAFLAGLAIKTIEKILEFYGKNFDIQFGIVGTTTLPGKIFAKLLVKKGASKVVLMGKTVEHLEELKQKCLEINNKANIETTINVWDIKKCDFVIITANNPTLVVSPRDIKTNAIVFDITQPVNPSTNKLKLEKDIIVGSGLAVATPGINYNFDFGLPPEQAFPCLAEVILLAKENKKENFGIGEISLSQVDEIVSLAQKYKFNPVILNKTTTWE